MMRVMLSINGNVVGQLHVTRRGERTDPTPGVGTGDYDVEAFWNRTGNVREREKFKGELLNFDRERGPWELLGQALFELGLWSPESSEGSGRQLPDDSDSFEIDTASLERFEAEQVSEPGTEAE